MNQKLGWFLVLAVLPIFPSLGVTVNDGSTTNNLTQFLNSSPSSLSDSFVSLEVGNCPSECSLKASQGGDNSSALFALRSAWYASDLAPTGGVYTVSAAFKPANIAYQNRGGVMGWLSLSTSNGIVLQVVPEDGFDSKSFRVAVVDFAAGTANDNESLAHLFNTNGTAATGDFASAWSELGTNYSATNFATFQLAFSASSNATAQVTARVFQGTDTNGTPIQVSRTIELLTDLAIPSQGNHRIGYYAVWASIFEPGDAIGYLDNLSGEGGVGLLTNAPPAVSISTPTSGATFTEPANIPIVASATDSDGTVTRVELIAGTTLLGTSTNSTFSLTWTNVPAGSYSLTARATDDRGGTNTSNPVNVTVNSSTGGPPMSIALSANSIEISWPTAGYQLQMKTNLSSPNWADVANTVTTNRVTLALSSANAFFRLVQQATSTGPRLTILLSGTSVIVSWPAQVTGYRLQSKADLNAATWADVASVNNQATETTTGVSRFYRLTP